MSTWHLIDATDSALKTAANSLAPELGPGFSMLCHRYQDGPAAGMQRVELSNGQLAVDVLPQRGMGIHQIRVGDWPIRWQSPVRGPVNPALVPLFEPSGLGWLDGFDELLCRCGLSSNGAPEFDSSGKLLWPLHGRIANTPAHELTITSNPDELQLRGIVDEARFHFQKLRLTSTLTLKRNETAIHVCDQVTNFSAKPGEMQLLYHINIGEPTLDAGSQIVAAAHVVVPRNDHSARDIEGWNIIPGPQVDYAEQVYFLQPIAGPDGWATILLKSANGTRGVSVRFDTRQLPYFILWKNAAASADGYVVGLEPAMNFPNPRSFEAANGRVKQLAAGSTAQFCLSLHAHTTAAEVRTVESTIVALQMVPARLESKPRVDWCA